MAGAVTMNAARILSSVLPATFAIVAVVVANLPISLFGGLIPAPLLALMPIYFWVLVRPDLMPPAAVLGIGLLEDLFSGGPPGLWAAGFLAAYALTDRQRDSFAGLSGFGAILGFAAVMGMAAGIAYILASLAYLRPTPLAPLLLEVAVTIAIYPLAAVVIGWAHRRFVGPMRSD